MRIQLLFPVLFLLQFFVACQQEQDKAVLLAGLPSTNTCQVGQEKSQPTAAEIVFQSADGGLTWQDISAGLPADLQAFCALSADGEVMLGAENGLFRSTHAPAAVTWEKVVGMDNRVTDIFPGKDGLYVCSYGSGIFQKIAGTDLWLPVFKNLGQKTVYSILETPGGSVFIAGDSGLFKSADGGKNWHSVSSPGMVNNLVWADGVLIGGGVHGLLRSTDDGEHWEPTLSKKDVNAETSLMDGGVAAIITSSDPAKQMKARAYKSRLCHSADNGKTWQNIDAGLLPDGMIHDVKQAGEYLFCSSEAGIFRSADKGTTWNLVRATNGKSIFKLAVSGQSIFAFLSADC